MSPICEMNKSLELCVCVFAFSCNVFDYYYSFGFLIFLAIVDFIGEGIYF